MNRLIETLIDKQGHELVNVPAELNVLVEMGFSEDEAIVLINKVISAEEWLKVRIKRDGLIRDTDYLVQPDYPLSDSLKAELTVYRQALRDIPQSAVEPGAIVWPQKPAIS